jgi:hypothetical protein
MENLIDNARTLFDEYLLPSSPPLPPAPAGEAVPAISYGTSHTKVALPALPSSGEAPGVDFTPLLPLRPAASIHPSTRSNPPMSPTRLCADPSACTTPVPPIPAALPPRIQTTMEAAERPTREPVVFDTGVTEIVEKAVLGPLPPPPTAAEQQLAAESAPETPLTASSMASSLSYSD